MNPDELDDGAEPYEVGAWYQFAAPGGFTMYGRYVRHLPYGAVRFVSVKHQRNGGGKELPDLAAYKSPDKFPKDVVLTQKSWSMWQGAILWAVKMG